MQRIVCGKCSTALKAPPQLASKSVKCPKCANPIFVPAIPEDDDADYKIAGGPVVELHRPPPGPFVASTPPTVPTKKPAKKPAGLSEAETTARVAELLGAFNAEFKRPRRGIGYRILEIFVLILVLLLPLIYLGMIAGVGWLLYSHAVNNFWMIGSMRGRAIILGMFMYGAIFVGLGAVLLAMILPAFGFGRQPEPPRRSLTRTGEPILFAMVDHLCDMINAPRPTRIDVDCEVNASAGSQKGVFSLFGSDLVLTIGLPLAAGFSAKQLIGVLAHEFGHFTQGFSSRLQYTIRRTLTWFANAASSTAGFDSHFQGETPQSGEGCLVAFALWIVRSCLWLGRQSLVICFYLGYLSSLSLLRRMEYDADAYEYGTVGVKAFESTFRSLRHLNEGWVAAINSAITTAPAFKGLPEDIPAFAAAIAADPSAEMERSRKKTKKAGTAMFDTHPADKDRIAAARASGAKGVFDSELPASSLFKNFPAMCRNATYDFYRQNFSTLIKPDDLEPNERLLELGRRLVGHIGPPARTF